jgi:hypothetical protein
VEAALPQVRLLIVPVQSTHWCHACVVGCSLMDWPFQAFESGVPDLSARFFLLLTSSCAGLANPEVTSNETDRVKFLRQAGKWAERARERKCDLSKISSHQSAMGKAYPAHCSVARSVTNSSHSVFSTGRFLYAAHCSDHESCFGR